jgi:hypothetical protein
MTFGNRISSRFKMSSMKQLLLLHYFAFALITSCASCEKDTTKPAGNTNLTGNKMRLTIGDSMSTATLYDNATATAFKALLPITLNMAVLNGNEKYGELPRRLPTAASN